MKRATLFLGGLLSITPLWGDEEQYGSLFRQGFQAGSSPKAVSRVEPVELVRDQLVYRLPEKKRATFLEAPYGWTSYGADLAVNEGLMAGSALGFMGLVHFYQAGTEAVLKRVLGNYTSLVATFGVDFATTYNWSEFAYRFAISSGSWWLGDRLGPNLSAVLRYGISHGALVSETAPDIWQGFFLPRFTGSREIQPLDTELSHLVRIYYRLPDAEFSPDTGQPWLELVFIYDEIEIEPLNEFENQLLELRKWTLEQGGEGIHLYPDVGGSRLRLWAAVVKNGVAGRVIQIPGRYGMGERSTWWTLLMSERHPDLLKHRQISPLHEKILSRLPLFLSGGKAKPVIVEGRGPELLTTQTLSAVSVGNSGFLLFDRNETQGYELPEIFLETSRSLDKVTVEAIRQMDVYRQPGSSRGVHKLLTGVIRSVIYKGIFEWSLSKIKVESPPVDKKNPAGKRTISARPDEYHSVLPKDGESRDDGFFERGKDGNKLSEKASAKNKDHDVLVMPEEDPEADKKSRKEKPKKPKEPREPEQWEVENVYELDKEQCKKQIQKSGNEARQKAAEVEAKRKEISDVKREEAERNFQSMMKRNTSLANSHKANIEGALEQLETSIKRRNESLTALNVQPETDEFQADVERQQIEELEQAVQKIRHLKRNLEDFPELLHTSNSLFKWQETAEVSKKLCSIADQDVKHIETADLPKDKLEERKDPEDVSNAIKSLGLIEQKLTSQVAASAAEYNSKIETNLKGIERRTGATLGMLAALNEHSEADYSTIEMTHQGIQELLEATQRVQSLKKTLEELPELLEMSSGLRGWRDAEEITKQLYGIAGQDVKRIEAASSSKGIISERKNMEVVPKVLDRLKGIQEKLAPKIGSKIENYKENVEDNLRRINQSIAESRSRLTAFDRGSEADDLRIRAASKQINKLDETAKQIALLTNRLVEPSVGEDTASLMKWRDTKGVSEKMCGIAQKDIAHIDSTIVSQGEFSEREDQTELVTLQKELEKLSQNLGSGKSKGKASGELELPKKLLFSAAYLPTTEVKEAAGAVKSVTGDSSEKLQAPVIQYSKSYTEVLVLGRPGIGKLTAMGRVHKTTLARTVNDGKTYSVRLYKPVDLGSQGSTVRYTIISLASGDVIPKGSLSIDAPHLQKRLNEADKIVWVGSLDDHYAARRNTATTLEEEKLFERVIALNKDNKPMHILLTKADKVIGNMREVNTKMKAVAGNLVPVIPGLYEDNMAIALRSEFNYARNFYLKRSNGQLSQLHISMMGNPHFTARDLFYKNIIKVEGSKLESWSDLIRSFLAYRFASQSDAATGRETTSGSGTISKGTISKGTMSSKR
ncbi:hypothetical protein [Parendozoicomonas sp. Alg238-R29]|uniref:hypothetical protein n=1 Tax=Parendozoicomonas sp. Alg238-R29 TaxID=2993446 RepID=UPI00248E90B6|nr:hypothetical protein [Parendozoicomonas sp. Alg238-R29]